MVGHMAKKKSDVFLERLLFCIKTASIVLTILLIIMAFLPHTFMSFSYILYNWGCSIMIGLLVSYLPCLPYEKIKFYFDNLQDDSGSRWTS